MARPKPLTDLQLVLLSHAAKTDTGSVFPLPASITDDERARSELSALLKRNLVAECEQPGTGPAWRSNDDRRIGLVLTDTGRSALGLGEGKGTTPLTIAPTGDKVVDPTLVATSVPAPAPAPARIGTKRDLVIALLSRPEGATLAEITAATGWQPHSARAVLTGLRKQGHELIKGKREDTTVYTITEVDADAVTDADAGAASARSTAGASA